MARNPNQIKISHRSKALPARRTGLVKTDDCIPEWQLGRTILVEILSAAAQVLRTEGRLVRQVRSSDPVETRSAHVSSAERPSRVEARNGAAEGGEGRILQPAACPMKLVGGAAEGGQAKMGRIIRGQEALGGVHLYNLRPTSCRWPLGPLLAHTERFCGEPCVPGCPYCPEHRERAFSRPGKQAFESSGTRPRRVTTGSNREPRHTSSPTVT
jgi:hypothetical protein